MVTEVSFYCNQLIINGEAVSTVHVDELIKAPYSFKNGKHFETMVCTIQDQYIRLNFKCGDPTPWNPELHDIQTNQNLKNTRKKTQVEPILYYGLIDLRKGWVWLPHRAKNIFKDAVKSVFKDVTLKSILNEQEFFEKIKTLDEVKFGAVPDNLFGSEDSLSKTLTQDIYAFDADYAELSLKYDRKPISAGIINSIKNVFNKRYAYSKIVVAGYDEQGLELLFNTEAISTKIAISAEIDENEMIITESLFKQLIEKIKNEG